MVGYCKKIERFIACHKPLTFSHFLSLSSIVTLKILVNILLLGKSFEYIESHQIEVDRKKNPPFRQCASLPSSRHQSMENIPASFHCKSTMNISGL